MVTRSRVNEDILKDMPVKEINQTASKERNELIKITKEKGISSLSKVKKNTVVAKGKRVSKTKTKAFTTAASQSHHLKHLKSNQKQKVEPTIQPESDKQMVLENPQNEEQ